LPFSLFLRHFRFLLTFHYYYCFRLISFSPLFSAIDN
jgi:hypothetical protein